jgi:hypothetical protein
MRRREMRRGQRERSGNWRADYLETRTVGSEEGGWKRAAPAIPRQPPILHRISVPKSASQITLSDPFPLHLSIMPMAIQLLTLLFTAPFRTDIRCSQCRAVMLRGLARRRNRRGRILYWLLSTSVRERGPLGFHRHPLSLCQVGLSHRSRKGIVLVHERKHRCMDSRPSGKAYHSSMRGLPMTSSGMTL